MTDSLSPQQVIQYITVKYANYPELQKVLINKFKTDFNISRGSRDEDHIASEQSLKIYNALIAKDLDVSVNMIMNTFGLSNKDAVIIYNDLVAAGLVRKIDAGGSVMSDEPIGSDFKLPKTYGDIETYINSILSSGGGAIRSGLAALGTKIIPITLAFIEPKLDFNIKLSGSTDPKLWAKRHAKHVEGRELPIVMIKGASQDAIDKWYDELVEYIKSGGDAPTTVRCALYNKHCPYCAANDRPTNSIETITDKSAFDIYVEARAYASKLVEKYASLFKSNIDDVSEKRWIDPIAGILTESYKSLLEPEFLDGKLLDGNNDYKQSSFITVYGDTQVGQRGLSSVKTKNDTDSKFSGRKATGDDEAEFSWADIQYTKDKDGSQKLMKHKPVPWNIFMEWFNKVISKHGAQKLSGFGAGKDSQFGERRAMVCKTCGHWDKSAKDGDWDKCPKCNSENVSFSVKPRWHTRKSDKGQNRPKWASEDYDITYGTGFMDYEVDYRIDSLAGEEILTKYPDPQKFNELLQASAISKRVKIISTLRRTLRTNIINNLYQLMLDNQDSIPNEGGSPAFTFKVVSNVVPRNDDVDMEVPAQIAVEFRIIEGVENYGLSKAQLSLTSAKHALETQKRYIQRYKSKRKLVTAINNTIKSFNLEDSDTILIYIQEKLASMNINADDIPMFKNVLNRLELGETVSRQEMVSLLNNIVDTIVKSYKSIPESEYDSVEAIDKQIASIDKELKKLSRPDTSLSQIRKALRSTNKAIKVHRALQAPSSSRFMRDPNQITLEYYRFIDDANFENNIIKMVNDEASAIYDQGYDDEVIKTAIALYLQDKIGYGARSVEDFEKLEYSQKQKTISYLRDLTKHNTLSDYRTSRDDLVRSWLDSFINYKSVPGNMHTLIQWDQYDDGQKKNVMKLGYLALRSDDKYAVDEYMNWLWKGSGRKTKYPLTPLLKLWNYIRLVLTNNYTLKPIQANELDNAVNEMRYILRSYPRVYAAALLKEGFTKKQVAEIFENQNIDAYIDDININIPTPIVEHLVKTADELLSDIPKDIVWFDGYLYNNSDSNLV